MAQLAARPALSVGQRLKDSLFYFPLILGGAIILVLVGVVLFGPLLAPHNPYLIDQLVVPHYDFDAEVYIRVPVLPGSEFTLGTDERGMDIVSLLLFGARTTVIAGVLVAAARVVIGLAAGMVMGWNENKWIDRLLLGVMNVVTSIPALVAAMILIYSLGVKGGMGVFVIALTAVGWTEVAQYMRSEVLVLRKMPFMEGARVVGASDTEMLLRHVFPNILPQLFVISFLEIGSVLMLVGELALVGVFIGGGSTLDLSDLMAPPTIVGIPTHPEWGASVASGFRWFRSFPHVVMMPALAIFLAVLGFNAFGEGLRAFFEKRGVKATFLLGKRLLYVGAATALVVYLVLNGTRPSLWFKDMAEGFQSSRMLADKETIKGLWLQTASAENIFPAAQWLGDQLGDYGFKGGIRWSNPIYARTADYRVGGAPALELNGQAIEASDLAYVVDDYGDSGSASGELVALSFPRRFDRTLGDQLETVNMSGRILVLEEGNTPWWLGSYFTTERNVAGIIWIAPEGDAMENAGLFVHPSREPEQPVRRVPVVRISHAVGEQLLAAGGADMSFFEAGEMVAGMNLGGQARVEVNLEQPQTIELNSVVAFRPGTDADLGDEIVLIYAMCDGWTSGAAAGAGQGDNCAVEYMLELARLLNENLIDTRRPILFVVWGGAEYGSREFVRWLLTEDSYSITAPGMRLSPTVTTAIQLVGDLSGNANLNYLASSHAEFIEILKDASREMGQPIVAIDNATETAVLFPPAQVPFQALIQVDTSGNAGIEEKQGETLAFMLIRLVREDVLQGD